MFVRQSTYDELQEKYNNLVKEQDESKITIETLEDESQKLNSELDVLKKEIESLKDDENSQITFVFKGDNYDQVTPLFRYSEEFANFLDLNGEVTDAKDSVSVNLAMIARAYEASEQIIENYTPKVAE